MIADAEGRVLARCSLAGPGAPGLGAVDAVARLALAATRLGGVVTLVDPPASLRELLDLTGLGIETTAIGTAGLRVEVRWETEGGEQPLVVEPGEEEVHRHDPST